MANRAALVTEAEVKRTVRGALAGGIAIGRIEVDHRTGKVSIVVSGVNESLAGPNPDELLK
ncbi:MAG: hypothetical protein Q8K33_22180 [Cypionkella sp.]|uniref:hypothetical protein n=1 Tax=Cypionkella sp. TaxID=2811411 RepID=UPI00272FD1B3|nr:hypothetical protein [Cypionkella sp.]MDP2051535.1 hypothetical protein [Cypionkella sp.]